jgi:hypothetical protein
MVQCFADDDRSAERPSGLQGTFHGADLQASVRPGLGAIDAAALARAHRIRGFGAPIGVASAAGGAPRRA